MTAAIIGEVPSGKDVSRTHKALAKVVLIGTALCPWIAMAFQTVYRATRASGSVSQTVASSSPSIVFLITGNRNGYLQPCGCTTGQKDVGLAVEAANIVALRDSIRKEGGKVLLLDFGHFASQQHEATQTISAAFKRMGYAVVRISAQDKAADRWAGSALRSEGTPYIDDGPRSGPELIVDPLNGLRFVANVPNGLDCWKRAKGLRAAAAIQFLDSPTYKTEAPAGDEAARPPLLTLLPYAAGFQPKRLGNHLVVSAPRMESILLCRYDIVERRFTEVRTVPVKDVGRRDAGIDVLVDRYFRVAAKNLQGRSPLSSTLQVPYEPATTCEGCHHEVV